MPRAVLFDLDGVLTTDPTGSYSTLRSLARHTGLPQNVLKPAYARHNKALLAGRITHADMWAEFCREVGQEIDFKLLHEAFLETPMDWALLHLVEELHRHGRTALVTDNKADRVAAILEHHHLHELFDVVSISAQVGSGKESPVIFRQTLEKLGCAACECLFIDNRLENLLAPQQMGMATFLFDDKRRDVAGLRRLLKG